MERQTRTPKVGATSIVERDAARGTSAEIGKRTLVEQLEPQSGPRIQYKAASDDHAATPAERDPHAVFQRATAGGADEVPYRRDMERCFGRDFSGVRAYRGRPDEMTTLHAHAATRGEDIVFATAQPDRKLVAHELAHVVQNRQSGGGSSVQGRSAVGEPDSSAEREADAAGERVAADLAVSVHEAPSAGIHLHHDASKPGSRPVQVDDVTACLRDVLKDGLSVSGIGKVTAVVGTADLTLDALRIAIELFTPDKKYDDDVKTAGTALAPILRVSTTSNLNDCEGTFRVRLREMYRAFVAAAPSPSPVARPIATPTPTTSIPHEKSEPPALAHTLGTAQPSSEKDPSLDRGSSEPAPPLYQTSGIPDIPYPGPEPKFDAGSRSLRALGESADQPLILYYLCEIAKDCRRYGRQLRAELPVDPKTRGQFMFQLDASGNGTGELLARKPVTLQDEASKLKESPGNFEILRERFASDLMITVIKGPWKVAELHKVHVALMMMPSPDRGAVRGITLLRVDTLDGGHTGAQFAHRRNSDERRLEVADVAFVEDTVRAGLTSQHKNYAPAFVGSRDMTLPLSVQTLLHEAGHAVEHQTELARNQEASQARRREQDAIEEATSTWKAYGAVTDKVKVAAEQAGAEGEAELDAIIDLSSCATRYRNAVIEVGMGKAQPQDATVRHEELGKEIAKTTAPRELVAEARKVLQSFQRRLEATLATRDKRAAEDAVYSDDRTHRLQNFVGYVKKHGLEPRPDRCITTYACEEWPGKPGEYYAEAYSLFLTDPLYLKTHFTKLGEFFASDMYRRDDLIPTGQL